MVARAPAARVGPAPPPPPPPPPPPAPPRGGRLRRLPRLAGGGVAVFIAALAALSAVHLWQGRGRFVGGGDVVHYMAQLDNLLERGDLDLTDRMERIMGERKVPRGGAEETEFISWSHARRNASGRIYSVHAWGYPVIAWPFAKVFGFDAGVSLLGLLLGALGATGVWAYGYIAGAFKSQRNIVFEAPFPSATNLALAGRPSVTTQESCLSAELKKGALRDELNLFDHPGYKGRKVWLQGDIVEAYYAIPGIKNITDWGLE